MSYKEVHNSKIVNKKTYTAKDGRSYSMLELTYPNFSYTPGQFVMIQTPDDGFNWAYPYLIYDSSPDSVTVLARERASVFKREAGNKEIVWGANGTGLTNPPALIITEPAAFFLAAPICKSYPEATLILIGDKASVPEELCPDQTVFLTEINEICSNIEAADQICLMLNLGTLEPLMSQVSETARKKTNLFVSTQIGCGIGACRACYLHSPEMQAGFPVCCNGPFLPYNQINFEVDRNCFTTFI